MIGIALRFVAGRYHATAWDRHVNEGTVEWPPSPWRLLRALVSAGYKADEDPVNVRRVLEQLLALPRYRLPPATEAHTRHYMPAGDSTTKVFDAFVVPGLGARAPGEAVVYWPDVTLPGSDRAVLERICAALTYVGRAESWVDARVVDDVEGDVARPDAWPVEGTDPSAGAYVSLQAPVASDAYAAWRRGFLDAQTGRKKREPPADVWAVLHLDTGELQREGWSEVPGTRWVRYALRDVPFRHAPRPRPASSPRPEVAVFALRSPVLPPIEHALALAELARASLLKRSDGHPTFLGRTATGEVMRGHRHAFFVPVDERGDGRVSQLVVWAREGFDAAAIEALEGLRELWSADGHPKRTLLVGMGSADAMRGASRVLAHTREWESLTPFVLYRHPKRRGDRWIDGVEDQARAASEELVGVTPVVARQPNDAPRRWSRFYRERRHGGGSRGADAGFGLRLTFPHAVGGPIALGYGAHFGLGLFVPVDSR